MRLMTRSALVLLAVLATRTASAQLVQNFDDVSTLAGAGWVFTNNSSPVGTTGWFQGNTAVFTSQAGASSSYVAANFNGAGFGAPSNISNWLLTPALSNLHNGQILTFYTRAEASAPTADTLEVRLSTSGASSNVGATDASVGDFTTLLLAVNPGLTVGGYPETWTLQTVTLSGLPAGLTPGRIAFRHLAPTTATNADFIGIDSLSLVSVLSDLSITNTPSSGTITGGTDVTYTLGVLNSGPSAADSVTVIYTLPAPLTFVSCLATNGGVCGGSGNARTVTYASLANAGSSTITMVAALPCSAVDGSTVSATATIQSASADPVLADNSATAVFTVAGALPAPVITAPSVVGAGSANRIASVPNTVGNTYAWSITNGTITAGQGTNEITFTAGTEGTPLTLSVTETSSLGCLSATGSATVTVGPFGSNTAFYAVTPCRQFDSRSGAPLTSGATLTVPLGGGSCGIPTTATAVSVNLAVTGSTAAGFVTLYPADGAQPVVSNINFGAGQTRANNAVVPLATDGSASIKVLNSSAGTLHVIVDVNGYFE